MPRPPLLPLSALLIVAVVVVSCSCHASPLAAQRSRLATALHKPQSLSAFTLDFVDRQSSVLLTSQHQHARSHQLRHARSIKDLYTADDDENEDDAFTETDPEFIAPERQLGGEAGEHDEFEEDEDDDDGDDEDDDSFDHDQDSGAQGLSTKGDESGNPTTTDSDSESSTNGTTTEQNDDADDADDADDKSGGETDTSTDDTSATGTNTTTTTGETTPVNQTTTTDPNESGTNTTASRADEAFAQFELLEMQELSGESNDAFKLVTIFSNKSFVGPFAGSPHTSDISVLAAADNSTWYEETAIQDRISFQIRYDTELESEYAIKQPSLFVSAGADTGIEPKLEFQLYPDSGLGSFVIYYNCVMGKPGTFPLGIRIPVTADQAIETGWLKICGSGRFEHISFGFLDHKAVLVPFNADGTYGVEEHHRLEVGPMDSTTDLKAQLKVPATNLNFLNPHIMSNTPDVDVKLRSTIAAGAFLDDAETTFTVLYDCEAKATGDIKFTVAIPPWDNITATWRKDCGGSMSQALLIGTGGPKSFDVMQEGQLKPEFKVSAGDSVDSVDTRVSLLSPEIHSQKFYFTNSDETSEIHFQKVSVTLSNPSVLSVIVPGDRSRSAISSVGGILQRGDVKALTLFFVCNAIGKSVVLVTVPTVRYQNVEFGFVKECAGAPKVYRHAGFLHTAGSLLDIILFLAIGGGIALCVYTVRKRVSGTKYSALATTES